MTAANVVRVELGDQRSYDVLIGDGANDELAGVMPRRARRAAVVTQEPVGVEVDAGIEQRTFLIPDGERAKTFATVERLCREFTGWGLTRSDAVVGVGGGVVTDVAGFAAAIYHRGVDVVHVATTLLAQIDAAIGGKTGVNLPEGKNLVGAFWQPHAVICDTATLATLPPREMRSGLGELAKYHFLGDIGAPDAALDERVAACVAIKAEVVATDEREGDRRAILNYGHTLAHAIEVDGSFDVRHGEAVAIGLVFAAVLAHRLGRIPASRVDEHRRVVAAYDLPSSLPRSADPSALVELMARDKKRTGETRGLTFVLDGERGVERVDNVDVDVVTAAIEEVMG